MDLIFAIRLLIRKKWIIISCTILAMVAAFLFTINKQRVFKSISQLSTGFTVSEEIKLNNDNFNITQIDVKFNNAIENFTSPKVLSLLSYNLILHDLTTPVPFKQPSAEVIKKRPEILTISKPDQIKFFQQKRDSMLLLNPSNSVDKVLLGVLESYGYHLEAIKKNLTVLRYQRTDYINITYFSENPTLSAYVVNEIGKEFRRYFDSFRRERVDESILGIDSLVRKKKAELDTLLALKAQFISDSAVLAPGMEMTNVQQIAVYENSLADERGRSQNLNYQIQQLSQQIKALEASGVKPVASSGDNSNSNNEYLNLRAEYNELNNEYVRKGSKDTGIKTKLEDLKRRMLNAQLNVGTNTGGGGGVDNSVRLNDLIQRRINAEGELRSASVKISFYQQSLNQLKGGVGSQASKNASLDQINKEIEITTTEYTAAKEKLNQAMNMNEGAMPHFQQTLFGQPSFTPEPSMRLAIIALSGFTAFVLCCAVFLMMQFFDQSIRTPSVFKRLTGLKLLGLTGWIPLKGIKISDHVVQTEDHKDDVSRNNSFRELLRKLRYEIENSGKRVFLFTSTEPQQGKTTLIQALAFSLSLGRRRVLILDTNFCNNDLTVANGAEATLESFKGKGEKLDITELEKYITQTPVENVDIIGCKGGDYTPSEILPKDHLLNYLGDLQNKYDFIFMEGAPMNGFTDTKELVKYVDAVIAIFSADAVIRQQDKESIQFLKSLKGQFLGAILNKVERSDVKL